MRTFTVLGLLVSSMIGSSLPSAEADQFAGRYFLIKDQSDDPRQAVNKATDALNFIVRPIARRQLSQKAVLYSSFVMERSGETFNTNLPGQPVLSLPLSGATVLWKAPDGEPVRVRLGAGPELVQIFEAKLGRRENRWTLSSDRRLLTVNVKITSPQLPRPVEYRAVYRRNL